MSEHPAQAAVNAIMADENVSPEFRRALAPAQSGAGDPIDPQLLRRGSGPSGLIGRSVSAFLICGCFRDGSFVCEEHKRREPK